MAVIEPVCKNCGHDYYSHAYGSRACDHQNHGNSFECGCDDWDPTPACGQDSPVFVSPVVGPRQVHCNLAKGHAGGHCHNLNMPDELSWPA